MAPMITLYILGGCVAVAALLFIVMIVLSALRPPELPNLSEPMPLQRMIRALTPLPIAMPASTRLFDEAPTTQMPRMAAARAMRSAAPATQAPVFAPPPPPPRSVAPPPPPPPRAAAPPPPPQAFAPPPPAFAPSPFVWDAPPRTAQPSAAISPAPSFVRVNASPRAVSRPRYPARRPRKLLRFCVGLFVTSVLATGAIVAYPAMLNPLCDDYEWFGADATHVVRAHARDAHAAIAGVIQRL
ncbi:MAG TPA: hypothetical protein VIV11_40970 [Kofleriaceae bacterium]